MALKHFKWPDFLFFDTLLNILTSELDSVLQNAKLNIPKWPNCFDDILVDYLCLQNTEKKEKELVLCSKRSTENKTIIISFRFMFLLPKCRQHVFSSFPQIWESCTASNWIGLHFEKRSRALILLKHQQHRKNLIVAILDSLQTLTSLRCLHRLGYLLQTSWWVRLI